MKNWKSSVIFAIALLAVVALVGSAAAQPDLNVTRIDVNRDIAYLRIADDRCTGEMAFGPTNHVGYKTQSNNISADITEGNGVDTGAFNVSFEVNGTEICNITTANLNGTTRRVWCNSSWYPLVGNYTITVTVDCNGDIDESDETNNTLSRDVTANVHGMKGNHWQDGRNISKLQCYEQGNINLIYSTGDSETLGGYGNLWGTYMNYTANWTASDIPIPDGATIKLARLYAYYNFDMTNAQNVTDYFNVTFNDLPVSPAVTYSDRKNPSGFGASGSGGTCPMNYYNFKYGELAYDVMSEFNASGNTVSLNNSQPQTIHHVSMTGMLLVVVYEHPDEPQRIICINEGFDMLKSGNYYNRHVGVTSEEATTYANFSGENILLSNVEKANLTTITNHGWAKTGDSGIYFNGNLLGQIGNYTGGTEIGVRGEDVKAWLKANDNTVTFRSIDSGGKYGGHLLEATNAFLVTTYGEEEEEEEFFDTHAPAKPYPSIMGIHNGTITPSHDISVSKLYTYPCTGTGGHTKSIELFENGVLIANGTWNGYIGDYHNLTIHNVTGAPYATLLKDREYNYTICTGSYPQIIHEASKDVTGGTITCTTFVDANGKEYNDRIPAIRLWG